MNRFSKKSIHALVAGLIGPLVLLFVIIGMNGLESRKNKKESKKTVSFAATKRKNKKNNPTKQIKKKAQKKRRPKVSAPKLAGGLNGASFGLEQFEFLGDMGDGLLGDSSNAVMTEDTVDVLPKVTYRPPLQYPSSARENNIEGNVVLNLLIGTKGEVQRVNIESSEPQGVFDQVAMESARNWQFEAAGYQGKKVKIWVRQKIAFNLK